MIAKSLIHVAVSTHCVPLNRHRQVLRIAYIATGSINIIFFVFNVIERALLICMNAPILEKEVCFLFQWNIFESFYWFMLWENIQWLAIGSVHHNSTNG